MIRNVAMIDFFDSWEHMGLGALALLVVFCIVLGSGVSIKRMMHDGSGSGITNQIGVIILAALICVSLAGTAGVVHYIQRSGGTSDAPTGSIVEPWHQQ